MEPVLKVEGVEFGYEKKTLIKGISFDVRGGEFFGIIGPNASGKTTLLKLIDGILRPWKGKVTIHGRSIHDMSRREVARKVALVFQENRLNFTFSAFEIVLMGRTPYLGSMSFEGKQDIDIAKECMVLTDTLAIAGRDINELSGGERQLVFIARALAQEPIVMLLDEPTAFLDLRHQTKIMDLLMDLNLKRGMIIILVSHDINLASQYCERLLLLKEGEIHTIGSPSHVITEINIRDVYKTPVFVDINPYTGRPRITLLSNASRDLRGFGKLSSI
jgi:iron complex transport system ATP-binding protein